MSSFMLELQTLGAQWAIDSIMAQLEHTCIGHHGQFFMRLEKPYRESLYTRTPKGTRRNINVTPHHPCRSCWNYLVQVHSWSQWASQMTPIAIASIVTNFSCASVSRGV
eukprot:1140404-Pelagomonas_calceolata.AAC.3